MPQSEMKVVLVRHTLSPEEVVALGARLCYSRARVDDLLDRVSAKDQTDFVGRIMGMGHDSVLEHASFTFGIEGVSRTLLAQITRHRLASFSVQSQRYVSYEKGFGYIVPPKIEALGEEAVAEFERQMDTMHEWYTAWQKKLGTGEGGNEDAPSGRSVRWQRRCTVCAWRWPLRSSRTQALAACAEHARKGRRPAARCCKSAPNVRLGWKL